MKVFVRTSHDWWSPYRLCGSPEVKLVRVELLPMPLVPGTGYRVLVHDGDDQGMCRDYAPDKLSDATKMFLSIIGLPDGPSIRWLAAQNFDHMH